MDEANCWYLMCDGYCHIFERTIKISHSDFGLNIKSQYIKKDVISDTTYEATE